MVTSPNRRYGSNYYLLGIFIMTPTMMNRVPTLMHILLMVLLPGMTTNLTLLYYTIPSPKAITGPPSSVLMNPISQLWTIHNLFCFYGGLTCNLPWHKTNPVHEPFPTGTCVTVNQDGTLVCDTIQNILLPFPTLIKSTTSIQPPIQPKSSSEIIQSAPV